MDEQTYLIAEDARLVKLLRQGLKNELINLKLLDELLTSLEGKMQPSTSQKKRIQHKDERTMRHMSKIIGSAKRGK